MEFLLRLMLPIIAKGAMCMSRSCIFTVDNMDSFPSMNQLRAAAIQNPGIPVIVKVKDTDQQYLYSDTVYLLVDEKNGE